MTAEEVLDRLFTNGFGEQAERLVLTSRDGRNLGGWCRGSVRDHLEMLGPPRFWPGQRVRMCDRGRRGFPRSRSRTATVLRVRPAEHLLRLQRDGIRRRESWGMAWWEPAPARDIDRPDEVCEALVAAYIAGRKDAALALADRLIELKGGTAT
jgi:hypothetical protein